MTCTEARHLIDAYLDRELDADMNAEVRAHVEGCAACAERLARRVGGQWNHSVAIHVHWRRRARR